MLLAITVVSNQSSRPLSSRTRAAPPAGSTCAREFRTIASKQVYLSFFLSFFLSIHLSVYIYLYLSILLSIYRWICVYLHMRGPFRDGPASGEDRSHLCRLKIRGYFGLDPPCIPIRSRMLTWDSATQNTTGNVPNVNHSNVFRKHAESQ